MVRETRFFYGWVIVGICLVSGALIYGIRHSFAVFFPPILEEFDWSRGSTAVMLSLNLLIYGFLAPLAGSLGDRWKPHRVMPIGIGILGLATAGCAFADELWHFYLLFGVLVPVGMVFSGWPLFSPALANWFARRRGLVMGLGQMGGGLSFTFGMFAEYIISTLEWRHAYLVLAGIVVAIPLPLYLLFFRFRPEDKGLRAYGTAELPVVTDSRNGIAASKKRVSHDWTLGRAMRTYQLWLLVLSYFLYFGVASYLVLAHQVKFTEDVGYSPAFAASVFALFGVFMATGQLSGFLSDWIGREKIVTLAAILAIGSMFVLISVRDTSQPWLLYIYAICFGYATGLFTCTLFASMADIFHGRHFGAIGALLLTGQGVGGAIGPWLGGHIYDISDSYFSAFILCMVCFVLASIAVWIQPQETQQRSAPKP